MSEISSKLFRDDPAAYYTELGARAERERIIKLLSDYFALTQEPDNQGNVTDNAEWDSGFQAAMALIRGEQK